MEKFNARKMSPAAIVAVCVVAVMVIVLVIIVWRKTGGQIVDAIKGKLEEKNSEKDYNTSASGAETETGQKPTLSKTRVGSLCKQIYNACRFPGTDENAVYSALGQLNNQADWVLLKDYYAEWWQANTSHIWCESTLIGTLTDDLSESELQKCREILDQKGIDPDF